MNEELPKLWGSWEPTVKGDNGSFTVGLGEKAEVTFSDITIQDYISFIEDLKEDLKQSKNLLKGMNILLSNDQEEV